MDTEEKNVPDFSLRPARSGDEEFALRMYLPLTRAFLAGNPAWDDERIVARFHELYHLAEVQMICIDGADIGWMQVSESDEELNLDQLHLLEDYRRRGIGTRLVRDLQARCQEAGKPFRLNVMRGNSAIEFYRRLGFSVVGGDKEKFHMLWSDSTE